MKFFLLIVLLFGLVIADDDNECLDYSSCIECVADTEHSCCWCEPENQTDIAYCGVGCPICSSDICPATEGKSGNGAVIGAWIALALGILLVFAAFTVDAILIFAPIIRYRLLENQWKSASESRAKKLRVIIHPQTALSPFRFRMFEPNACSPEYPTYTELTPTVKEQIGAVFTETPIYRKYPELCKTALLECEAMYEGLLNSGKHATLHQNQVIALLLFVYHIGDTSSNDKCVYTNVNKCLRDHSKELLMYSDFLYYLLTGLRRLEKVELVEVFRQTTEIIDLEQYRPGMPICWNSFTSASLSAEKASAAVVGVPGDPGVLFAIRSLDARRLRLPRFAEEDEVLFEPNSEFVVKELIVSNSFEIPHKILMEQIQSTKPLLPPLPSISASTSNSISGSAII